MKRALFVPLVAALLLSACADFQRRPYRYTRVYSHQKAAHEKILSQRLIPDALSAESVKATASPKAEPDTVPLVPVLPQ